jgi:hypothetical protein
VNRHLTFGVDGGVHWDIHMPEIDHQVTTDGEPVRLGTNDALSWRGGVFINARH